MYGLIASDSLSKRGLDVNDDLPQALGRTVMTGRQPHCQETNDHGSVGQGPFSSGQHFKFQYSFSLQRSRISLPLVLLCFKKVAQMIEFLSRTKNKKIIDEFYFF